MSEWRMIVLLAGGPLCWMIGGTWWRPTKVLGWPILCGVMLASRLSVWVALTMIAVNSLPYGDSIRWPLRLLVFAALGLPCWWLHHAFGLWWALGTMLVLTTIEFFSRKYNWVTHKLWEALAGFLQASSLVLGTLR